MRSSSGMSGCEIIMSIYPRMMPMGVLSSCEMLLVSARFIRFFSSVALRAMMCSRSRRTLACMREL